MRRRIDPRLWWLLAGAAGVSLAWLGVTIGLIAVTLGCNGNSTTVIEETDEYSFDDVAAQLAAEEQASIEGREE